MIPKRIICTHRSRAVIGPQLRDCLRRMQSLHRDWEFLFFSDGDCADLVKSRGDGYSGLYEWYPRAVMKADFFRIFAVYTLGGFYLDTDVWLARKLDPLRKHAAVFPWEWEMPFAEFELRYPPARRENQERAQVGNYAFGARNGHPFLRAVLDEMVRRTEHIDACWCPDIDVLYATGPDVVTTVYYRNQDRWHDLTLLHGDPHVNGPQPPVGDAFPKHFMRFGRYGSHLLHGGWKGGM